MFVCQQLVEAAIERVLCDQRIVLAEQIRHRALLEPQPMQAPLASRINQSIADERLQNMPPAGSLARVGQPRRPEPIQFELLIEMARQPARAPLARAMQLHRLEPHLHAKAQGADALFPRHRDRVLPAVRIRAYPAACQPDG
jgi:hypothetical protein